MALDNTPPVPPQQPDNQTLDPLGVLNPSGLEPLEGLPSPGLTIVPELSSGRYDVDPYNAIRSNSLSRYAGKTFDPANITQPIRYTDESFTKLQKTFDNPDRDNLFTEIGFYPFENNEDRFARSLTRWQKMGLAWDQMTGLAAETFKEQWVTEGKFWKNLVSGDLKEAFLPFSDTKELADMGRTMQQISTENYIPLTEAEQRGDEFGFGKFATTVGQFGFTLGTIGAFSTQLVLEFAAAAILAPETEGASIAAAGASLVNKVKRILTLGKFYKNLSKIENSIESANKIKQAYQYFTKSSNIKAGLGSFYSFTKQWNAAAAEAKFEAASSYVDYMDEATRKAKEEGRMLTLGERANLEKEASDIAMGNGITNTGLLYVMNRINMGNLFRGPFGAQKRFLSELSGNIGDDLVRTAKGWVRKGTLSMFTKEGAAGAGKGLFKWGIDSAWEGVQEVVQGSSSEFWNKYYKDQYDRKSGFEQMYLAGKAVSDHLDGKNAFDEFISGFIIGVPGTAVNMSIGKALNSTVYKKQMQERKNIIDDYAAKLNKWEENPLRVFDPRIANANNQMEFSKQMSEAIKSGDIYAYKNLHNQQMRDMIVLGLRTGKLEYMMDTMRDQLNNLSADDFEAIFKVTADSSNKKSAMDYLNTFEQKAADIAKDYDKIKQEFPNAWSDFSKLKDGTEEKKRGQLRYIAWENAVQDLIFEKDTYRNVIGRMSNILGDVKDSLGDALYNPFYTATSDENITTETLLLQDEIKNLKSAETQDEKTKKLIADKERQLRALSKWRDSNKLITESFTRAEGFSLSMAEFTDESKAAFKELMDAYQDTMGGDMLTSEQIEAGYKGMIDYARLNNDKGRAVTNISLLSSPEGFAEQFDRHFESATKFYTAEMFRRQAVVQLRTELLKELDSNTDFANQPKVKVLYARLREAAANREFDTVDELMDEILDEYNNYYQTAKEVETAPEQIGNVHTVKQDADGTFSVISPQGNLVQKGIATEDEANEIAKNLDEAMSQQPTPQPVATPPVTQPPTRPDIPLGKVDGTNYEVKADGVYFEGEKLDNRFNKSNRELIEAHIEERLRKEEIDFERRGKEVYAKQYGLDPNMTGVIPAIYKAIKAKYDAELAALEGGKQAAPVTPTPSTPTVDVDNLIERISNATQDELLEDFVDYITPGNAKYDSLSPEQRDKVEMAISQRATQLIGLPKKVYSQDDPQFKAAYNTVRQKIRDLLKNSNVAISVVIKAFEDFTPVLDSLADNIERAKWMDKVNNERDSIVRTLKKNADSKNMAALKSRIADAIKNLQLLSDMDEAALTIIGEQASPEIKEELIKYYVSLIDKRYQEAINKIEQEGSAENDSIVLQYINDLAAYKSKIQGALEIFKQQSQTVATKMQGVNLTVDVDNDYENDTHVSIVNGKTSGNPATAGQKAAISNLINAGTLSADVDGINLEALGTKADASEHINLGVARIYTININKAAYIFISTGKIDELEEQITNYLLSNKGKISEGEIKYKAKDIIDDFKTRYAQDKESIKVADILEELNIPITSEITDEQYKLLKEYNRSINRVQSEANLLANLESLSDKKNKFLQQGTVYKSIEEVLSAFEVEEIAKRFLKKAANNKPDVVTYYNDLLDVIENIRVASTKKEADNLIKALVNKHAPTIFAGDLRNVSKAMIATVLEVEAIMFNNQAAPTPLTDEEIVRILNGEQRTLTASQMEQVRQYKEDLIEASRGKLSRAPGYEEIMPELTLEELTTIQPGSKPGMLALRAKDDADIRTEEDLMQEYQVKDGRINTRLALQNIINSEFATLGERELARKLLGRTAADDTIEVNNSLPSSGDFDPDTNNVAINMKQVGYTEEKPYLPIETVILHELLHREIELELQNPSGEFTKAIKSAMAAVRNNPAAKTFYAFQENLTDDEQIREFVIEAFTNPSFQHLLSTIPYAKSGKSVWEKFLEILSNLLKSIGIDVEGTVLNEVINQTAELIKSNYTNELLGKVAEASTIEELNSLSEDLTNYEDSMVPSLYSSAQKLISSKIQSIRDKEASKQVQGMSKVKIGKQTYYYTTKNGILEVFNKTRKGVTPVKAAIVYEQVFMQLLKSKSINELLSDSLRRNVIDIMGDPDRMGSYASGQMLDVPLSESQYAPFVGLVISLPFKSQKDYADFKNEYWRFVKEGALTKKYAYLKDRYGATAVGNYDELTGYIDSRSNIEKLIKKGLISIDRKGLSLEEILTEDDTNFSESQLVDYMQFLIEGGNIDSSEYEETRRYINSVLKQTLGVNISDALQTKIELELQNKREEPAPADEEETETTGSDEGDVTYTPPVHKQGSDPAIFDASVVDPSQGISAMDTNALRSLNNDVFPSNQQETPYFTQYYHKVRAIINALHIMDKAKLGDVFVTIHADNEGLRWDGSVDEDWKAAKKGVVGFLSDINGNPIVFAKDGTRLGTLDRANLSDKKGLDNGENQIVYFKLFAEDSKSPMAKLLTKESYDKLNEARRKAMAGNPQIADLTVISAGQMNKRKLARSNQADRKNTAKDPGFLAQLMQPNISFKFNNKGVLMMMIKDKNGAVNEEPLYPPNTRYVNFNKNGVETPFINHIVDVMKTYHEMLLRGDKNADVVKENLIKFVYNIWLTGENFKIPNTLSRFTIKQYNDDTPTVYDVIKVVNGEALIDEAVLAQVVNKVGNRPINISKKWWNKETGFEQFLFPVIVDKEGVKSVEFRDIDYKNFIMTKVGLSSDTVEIPAQDQLIRYNSIVAFTNPRDIQVATPAGKTADDLLNDPNAVKNDVKNNVNTDGKTSQNEQETNAIKKKKKFRAPTYDEIFEKNCK